MLTTNKDFDGISDNGHPTTYYWSKGDTKPVENVINGAAGIEMDATNGTTTVYFFDKTSGTWVGDGGGGGGSSGASKQVNFIDYDGTMLHSYTRDEINSLTVLPENPSHTGLVAQGWNWTLAQIKAQLTAMPDALVWVGQMYFTESGDTEIDVRFDANSRLSPMLTIAVDGTVTVDWGDGTIDDTVTGTDLTVRIDVPHTYASVGDYTIKIHGVDGTFTFYEDPSYPLLRIQKNSYMPDEKHVYISRITSIRIGSNIENICNYAFFDCTGLTSVTIPSSVTSIGDSAFDTCCNLTSVTIPNSVTNIGDNVFNTCYNLTSITIPNSVTSIGDSAFAYCYSLTSITIPNSVTSIGDGVFNTCTSLTSIMIPNSVTSIGDSAFKGCISLTSVMIPSLVTSIGDSAFNACTSLTSITIPNSVTSIGGYTFDTCTSLTSITIPNSITSIGEYAFEYCTGLTSITIPNSVTSIGDGAFEGCTSLTSVTIPNSVTSIGDGAFFECTSLTSITIPNSVTNISDNVFNTCYNLTSVTIPSSVTSIGDSAFFSCCGVGEYHVKPISPPEINSSTTFENIPSDCVIYVPSASLETYKADSTWSNLASYMIGE